MPSLINGRVLLGAAFVGLAAAAGTMIVVNQDDSKPAPAASQVAPQVVVADPKAPAPAASASPAVDDGFTIKRILPIEGAIKYGEWHWDDKNVPAGPIVITVDLDARVLSIFQGGYEIGAAAVLIGSQEKPTPLGVFPIMQKKVQHTSNLYDAEMPYMQRLTNDGIALHASNVRWGYASHGCISMPLEFAKKVYESTKVGDKVYVTRGKQIGMGDSLTS